MKLIFSGEGPTDLGTLTLGPNGANFVPGPMAWIVDKLLETNHTAFSMIESHNAGGDCIVYVDETRLASFGKKGPTLLPGVKHGKGNSFFAKNAQCLGLFAKQISVADSDIANISVLFRDGDATNSKNEWQEKIDSMRRGFAQVDYTTGVPMVPNPISEAWLICALRNPPYTNCASIEDESGNDKSPNALKGQLNGLCGGSHPSAEMQADWVKGGRVDPERIEMPSFSAFKQALRLAAQNAGLADLQPLRSSNF